MNQNCNCEIHKTNGEAPRAEEKKHLCEICGEPMPEGEEMFRYHGSSGPCPKPPLRPTADTRKTVELPRPFREIIGALRYASRTLTEPNGEIYSRDVHLAAAKGINQEIELFNEAVGSNTARLVITEKLNQEDD